VDDSDLGGWVNQRMGKNRDGIPLISIFASVILARVNRLDHTPMHWKTRKKNIMAPFELREVY
jgi:hypothetical protein